MSNQHVTKVTIANSQIVLTVEFDKSAAGQSFEISGHATQNGGAFASFYDVKVAQATPDGTVVAHVAALPVAEFKNGEDVTVVLRVARVSATVLGERKPESRRLAARGNAVPSPHQAELAGEGTTWNNIRAVATVALSTDPERQAAAELDARPLTITESAYLLEACELVVGLLALDEMWSVYLTAAQESRVGAVDFSGLLGLSERMLDGLGELVETGPRAADLVSSQSGEPLIAGLQRLRDQYGPAELFDWLLDEVAAGTPLHEVFLSAWSWILGNVDDERQILLNKRKALSEGSLPDPDFRFRFKCYLVVAGIGAGAALAAAGAVATLGVGGVVGLGVLVAAGGTAAAWKDSGCGGEVRPAHG